jgi:hypothetical protein
MGRLRDLIHSAIESQLVSPGRLGEAAQFAHELNRRSSDFFVGRRRFEIVKSLNISTHDTCASSNRNSVSGLSSEHGLVDLLRITQHDEANVTHVFLRHALHFRGSDRAQLFQKHERVVPASAD